MRRASERIQREVLVSMFEACPSDVRTGLGLRLETIADVVVSSSTTDPSILLNRAQGLGSREPVTRDTIEAVVAEYARCGIGRFFFHVHPSALPPYGAQWLEQAGLVKARGWMQFVRSNAPVHAPRTDLTVERVGSSRADDFAAIACDGFDLTVAARPFVAAIVDDPRWHCFMTFSEGTPAGTGALLVQGGTGYLSFAATAPAFRRQGSQGALMAARIQAAIELGCEYLFTETGEAVEGEEQVSYRNIERFGFEAQLLCENWTLNPEAL